MDEVLRDDPEVRALLTDEQIAELVDPANYLGRAPEVVDAALAGVPGCRGRPMTVAAAPGAGCLHLAEAALDLARARRGGAVALAGHGGLRRRRRDGRSGEADSDHRGTAAARPGRDVWATGETTSRTRRRPAQRRRRAVPRHQRHLCRTRARPPQRPDRRAGRLPKPSPAGAPGKNSSTRSPSATRCSAGWPTTPHRPSTVSRRRAWRRSRPALATACVGLPAVQAAHAASIARWTPPPCASPARCSLALEVPCPPRTARSRGWSRRRWPRRGRAARTRLRTPRASSLASRARWI